MTQPSLCERPAPPSVVGHRPTTAWTRVDRKPEPADGDEYGHLAPLLERYARLPGDDPQRGTLRTALVEGYRPVVRNIARRFAHRGEPLEDVEQVGAEGLLGAIDRFDPERGHFLAFAVPTITGQIRRYFRDRTWPLRVSRREKDLLPQVIAAQSELTESLRRAPRVSEIAHRLGVAVDPVIDALHALDTKWTRSLDAPAGEGPDALPLGEQLGGPDAGFEAAETVVPALSVLPRRERAIIEMRFYRNMSQSEIGRRIGVSQMHVSRLLARSLARLRDHVTAEPAPVHAS